jgi:hypothetical protein
MKRAAVFMISNLARLLRILGAGLILLAGISALAQEKPSVYSEVDTTSIRIGEQIRYTITVDTDTTANVIFPEGQTFSPLETVEAFKADTTRASDRMTLQKTYALTQFDSGAYTIPTQRIEINGQGFFTDSVQVAVATVPVDTLAQKMYGIKPVMEVEKSNSGLWKWLLLGLAILLVTGGLLYWFVFRKKPMTAEEKAALLPPYERALMELKRLETSRYLIQDEYKQYYTELTGIIRSYLEEDVHVTALESTTDQLLDKLHLLMDAGELKLDENTLSQFRKILQTADLVKFAKSRPATSVAEQDRKTVEQLLARTHEALPEPTEEELMAQEEYKISLRRKKQKRKYMLAAAIVLFLMVAGGSLSVAYYGFGFVRDSILGHPSKSLLEGEWVRSTYGFPPIQLETPEVLYRQKGDLSSSAGSGIKDMQEFRYTNPDHWFMVGTASLTLNNQEDPDYEAAVDNVLGELEKQGGRNILTKQEEFTTSTGVTGIKVYGSGTFIEPDSQQRSKGHYAIYLFGGKGFQQRVVLSWLDDDPYAAEMVDRIVKSIDVKTQV